MYKYILKINSFFGNIFSKRKRKTWEKIKEETKTHHDIYRVLNGGLFEYSKTKDNIFDWIQRPDVFVASGKGDCDDFANFSYELLCFIGYKARLVGIWENNFSGHAVACFEYGGNWYYFSNKSLIGPFNSFNSSINDFYREKTFKWEIIK